MLAYGTMLEQPVLLEQSQLQICSMEIGSPGLVFKLTESAICEAIETIARRWEQISLSDAAGKLQFSFEDEPLKLAADILDSYYRLGR
jgi:Protein of unknown function (DUF4007)